MLKIAITGNIASGKSQIEKILSDKGYIVFDADKIAHSCLDGLTEFYGYDVFTNGKIDRIKLGKLVFSIPDLRTKLENILHPLIKSEIFDIFEKYKEEQFVFISVPLLFETDFYKLFDKVILVTTDEQLRLKRLMKRNNLSEEDALARINSQMAEERKIDKSDYVLKNDSSLEALEQKLSEILENLSNIK